MYKIILLFFSVADGRVAARRRRSSTHLNNRRHFFTFSRGSLPEPPPTPTTSIESETAAVPIDAPIHLLPGWMQAPYPTELIAIHDERLRSEVFRSTLSERPVDPRLDDAFHHTGLEHRGDALAYLVADEVRYHFFRAPSLVALFFFSCLVCF